MGLVSLATCVWFFTVHVRGTYQEQGWYGYCFEAPKNAKMEMTPKKSKVSKPSCVSFLTFLLFSPLLSFFFSCCFCSSIAGTTIIVIINTHRHHHPSIINHHIYIFWFHQHHGHHSRSIITISSFQRSQQISAFLLTTKHFRLCCSCLNRSCSFYQSAFKPSKHVSMFCSCQSTGLPLILSENHIYLLTVLRKKSPSSEKKQQTTSIFILRPPPKKKHPKNTSRRLGAQKNTTTVTTPETAGVLSALPHVCWLPTALTDPTEADSMELSVWINWKIPAFFGGGKWFAMTFRFGV